MPLNLFVFFVDNCFLKVQSASSTSTAAISAWVSGWRLPLWCALSGMTMMCIGTPESPVSPVGWVEQRDTHRL